MALSASDRDPSADPGVDFYRFANGGWLDANPIPAGYGSWGSFEEVGRRNELALRELLERAAETPGDLLGDAFSDRASGHAPSIRWPAASASYSVRRSSGTPSATHSQRAAPSPS